MSNFPTTNPKVMDANGALIDFQGVQKVRTYPMPIMAVTAFTGSFLTGTPFPGGITRGFTADVAGTATITDAQGNVITNFPISAGRNDIAISAINNLSGATKIWGLY